MSEQLIEREVNIYEFPKVINSDTGAITIGDLHGNSMKLLFMLISHGVVENLDEKDYARLVELFRKAHELTQEDLKEFNNILNNIKINNQLKIRLIGDEVADRTGNDYFTLKIFEKLLDNKVDLEVLISNHGMEFISAYEGEQGFTQYQHKLGFGQANSLVNLQMLLKNKVIDEQEVRDLIDKAYKPVLRLLSYEYNEEKTEIIIYSHAPINVNRIEILAGKLAETTEQKFFIQTGTVDELAAVIDLMNETFTKNLVLEQKITQYEPAFFHLTWSREEALAKSSQGKEYSLKFAYGHTGTEGQIDNIFNLNNELGKATEEYNGKEYFKGKYSVLRSSSFSLHCEKLSKQIASSDPLLTANDFTTNLLRHEGIKKQIIDKIALLTPGKDNDFNVFKIFSSLASDYIEEALQNRLMSFLKENKEEILKKIFDIQEEPLAGRITQLYCNAAQTILNHEDYENEPPEEILLRFPKEKFSELFSKYSEINEQDLKKIEQLIKLPLENFVRSSFAAKVQEFLTTDNFEKSFDSLLKIFPESYHKKIVNFENIIEIISKNRDKKTLASFFQIPSINKCISEAILEGKLYNLTEGERKEIVSNHALLFKDSIKQYLDKDTNLNLKGEQIVNGMTNANLLAIYAPEDKNINKIIEYKLFQAMKSDDFEKNSKEFLAYDKTHVILKGIIIKHPVLPVVKDFLNKNVSSPVLAKALIEITKNNEATAEEMEGIFNFNKVLHVLLTYVQGEPKWSEIKNTINAIDVSREKNKTTKIMLLFALANTIYKSDVMDKDKNSFLVQELNKFQLVNEKDASKINIIDKPLKSIVSAFVLISQPLDTMTAEEKKAQQATLKEISEQAIAYGKGDQKNPIAVIRKAIKSHITMNKALQKDSALKAVGLVVLGILALPLVPLAVYSFYKAHEHHKTYSKIKDKTETLEDADSELKNTGPKID